MPQLRFLISSQNAEKGTTNAVAPEELPNLKQCRRSRKFTFNFWVVSFRVLLEFFFARKVER